MNRNVNKLVARFEQKQFNKAGRGELSYTVAVYSLKSNVCNVVTEMLKFGLRPTLREKFHECRIRLLP